MANNPSDLIQFKRGTMANLETLINNKSGIDGTFYLTIDDDANDTNNPSRSSRLFVGRADGSIVPVNQGIITVSSVNDLTNGITGKWHAGDYAYVTGSNILAIYDGQRWKQINQVGQDTYVDSITDNVSTSNGVVTVETDALMNDGVTHKTDSFTLTGSDGVSVSSTGKAITISGDPYTLSSAAVTSGSNSATIKLASTDVANAGSITVSKKSGSIITVEGNANQIVIGAEDKSPATATLSNETSGFGLVITKENGSATPKTTIDPTIAYGGDGTSSATFQNGTATLDIYNKTEIDAKFRGIDAMTYKGTVGTGGSASTTVAGITNTSIGDTYKLVGNNTDTYTIPVSGGGTVTAHGGDIIIANGTEDPATNKIVTNTLYFDVIESGNDIDTTYSVTSKTNGINIVSDVNGNAIGSIALAAGNKISLSESGTNNKTVTVNHSAITTAATNGTAITQADNTTLSNLAVITGVTTDGYGHVSGVETTNVTIKDTNATLTSITNSVTAGTGKAIVQTQAVLTHANGTDKDTKSDSFEIASDNLSISASGKQVKANFVWGTF